MHFSGYDLAAWAAGCVSCVLLVAVLLVRGRARSFPCFTIFVLQQIVSAPFILLAMHYGSPATYRHAYWGVNAVDELLQLLVFYEVAVHVFCPTGVWAKDVRKTLLGMVGVGATVALSLAWLTEPATRHRAQTLFLRSNFFSAALMSELFVGMVVLSSAVGLPWKTHVARIAQGLGTYSLLCVGLDIAVNWIGLLQGRQAQATISHLRGLASLACHIYWIRMLWAEAPAPRELPDALRSQIYTLQRQVEGDLVRLRVWRKN